MNQRDRVIISGLGAVSPGAVGVPAYTAMLRAGTSAIRLLSPDLPGRHRIRSSVAAYADTFDPSSIMSEADQHRLPRLIPMALAAAREALIHARWLTPSPTRDDERIDRQHPHLAPRIGLILGTGAGGIDFTLDQAQIAYGDNPTRQPSLWTITNATHGNLAGELSIRLGLHGPSWCISTGCASSSDAIAMATHLLRTSHTHLDAFVVVGADAHIRWETLLGMELLRVISTEDHRAAPHLAPFASRPFDRTRRGFILGEGAWSLIIEREDSARRREIPALAHCLGSASTCDAYHRVRPDPDLHDCIRAIQLALTDANLTPEQIDIIHYHGTATRINDAQESAAAKAVFADHATQLIGHSVKGAIGHPQGACGSAAAVATIAAMTGQDGHPPFLPPTVGLDEPDLEEGCTLNYTPQNPIPRTNEKNILINCLAFGAKNSALIMQVT